MGDAMKRRTMWNARIVLVGVSLLPIGAFGQTPPEDESTAEQAATANFTCNAKFTPATGGRAYNPNTGVGCVDGVGSCSFLQ
jgi:hypothetical protein